jgi:tetratricopeptide (TPR) repeat protein
MQNNTATDPPKPLVQAVSMALDGKFQLAEEICRRSAKDRASQANSLTFVAKACIQSRDEAGGIYLLERAVKICPSDTAANVALADLALGNKEFPRALVYLRNLNQAHPNSPDLFIALAQAYGALGMCSEATEAYRSARSLATLPCELLWEAARQAMAALKYEDAIGALRDVLKERPEHIPTLNDLGVALLQDHQNVEAETCFREVIRKSPSEIPARLNLISILKQSERYEESLVHLYHVRSLMPRSATVFAGIAQTLVLQERFTESLTESEAGLAIDPGSAELHHHKGLALRGLRRHQEAMAYLTVAEEMQPTNGPVLLAKGNTALELGDLPLAKEMFERLLDVQHQVGSYHRSYSKVHKYAKDDPHIHAMHRLLDQHWCSEADATEIQFALGKAYDDIAEFTTAFHHFAEGNRLKRATFLHDEAQSQTLFDVMRQLDLGSSEGVSRACSDLPVFVIGMPRSGTSLIEQILASHPDVVGLGERPDWQAGLDADSSSLENVLRGPGADWLTALGTRYLNSTASDAEGFKRSVDKMPSNFHYAGLIHLALPNAKIIHLVRNPLDTCLSCYSQLFSSPQTFAYDLAELGRYYGRYSTLMEHWRTYLPQSAWLDVRYEAVVDNLEGEVKRLLEFCGLPWDDRCLSFHASKSTVTTASVAQVRQPIYRSSVGRREGYLPFLGPLIEAMEGSGWRFGPSATSHFTT